MFLGVQFAEPDGGSISLVHEKWLTPRKGEVWWPPHKQQDVFVRSLKKGESPNEQWKLYKIEKTIFHDDNYQKAFVKLKRAEETSDIATDIEDALLPSKRLRIPNRKLFDSSSDESDSSEVKNQLKNKDLKRSKKSFSNETRELPPKIQLQFKENTSETSTLQKIESINVAKSTQRFGEHSESFNTLSQIELHREEDNTRAPDFQKNTLSLLLQIKHQNKQILNILQEKNEHEPKIKLVPPRDFPVELPIKNLADLNKLEDYLSIEKNISALASYCGTFGGRDKVGRVNNILRNLITNRVAAQYSFLGSRKEKHAFSALNLRKVVVSAVLTKVEGDADEVDSCIKIWLKHAPKRLSLERKKQEKQSIKDLFRKKNDVTLKKALRVFVLFIYFVCVICIWETSYLLWYHFFKMPKLKLKKVVSERQMYRRVNAELQKINLNSPIRDQHFESQQLEHLESQVPNNVFYNTQDTPAPNSVQNEIIDDQSDNELLDNTSIDSSAENDLQIDKDLNPNPENLNLNPNPEENLKLALTNWALEEKVTHSALTKLLHVLKPYHQELPLDSRTLLSTPQSFNTIQLETGSYIHLGLEQALIYFLKSYKNFTENVINISFNIDGLPLYKSSNMQAWPILALIKNFKYSTPFAVGVFCGTSKPAPLNLYLDPFIREFNRLKTQGLLFENKIYSICIHSFICDAPAKAYIKCIKSHGGYSSCDKCTEVGSYVNGRVVFKNTNSSKRTNESFRAQLDEDHHVGVSPLLDLDMDLIHIFPIDYMHNVCLGVMKKLLNYWVGGHLNVRLPNRLVTLISNRLTSYVGLIPGEINRKPRPLSELPRFKATEFRTFLLYTGIVALRDIVDEAIYNHFLLFHTAITLLMSTDDSSKSVNCENSKKILQLFISHGQKLYGPEFLIYNIHVLAHLPEDVLMFGPLDTFSAFPFENYLGNIKKMVRSPTNPLQQICRRLIEFNTKSVNTYTLSNEEFKLEFELFNGPTEGHHRTFQKLRLKNYFLTIYLYSKADAYCFTDNFVIQVQNIIREKNNDIKIKGKFFTFCDSFYKYPFNSSNLHIHLLSGLTNYTKTWRLAEIIGKCVILPYKEFFVSVPLLHTYS